VATETRNKLLPSLLLLSKELKDCNKSNKKKEEKIKNLRIMNYDLQEKYDNLYKNYENCKVFNVEEINNLNEKMKELKKNNNNLLFIIGLKYYEEQILGGKVRYCKNYNEIKNCINLSDLASSQPSLNNIIKNPLKKVSG